MISLHAARMTEQIMAQVAEHAKKDHGMQTIPNDVAQKVKASIHEE